MGFQRFYLIAGAFFCVKLVGEGYAVSFRLGAPGDAGMVPLSSLALCSVMAVNVHVW